jgi:hypothetical protein
VGVLLKIVLQLLVHLLQVLGLLLALLELLDRWSSEDDFVVGGCCFIVVMQRYNTSYTIGNVSILPVLCGSSLLVEHP